MNTDIHRSTCVRLWTVLSVARDAFGFAQAGQVGTVDRRGVIARRGLAGKKETVADRFRESIVVLHGCAWTGVGI